MQREAINSAFCPPGLYSGGQSDAFSGKLKLDRNRIVQGETLFTMTHASRYEPDPAATRLILAFLVGLVIGGLLMAGKRRLIFSNVIIALQNARVEVG